MMSVQTKINCFSVVGLLLCLHIFHYTIATESCNGTLKSDKGVLESPDYPYNIPANSTCEWLLPNISRPFFYLRFTDFTLAAEDKLEIVNQDNSTITLSGTKAPFLIVLDSKAVINYVAGPTPNVERRFSATYNSEECKFVLSGESGSFSFPNGTIKGNGSLSCTWVVTSAPNTLSTTALSFLGFNLSSNEVYIYNGTEPSESGHITSFKGNNLPPDVIGTSQMTVVLNLTLPIKNIEFSVRFESTTPECTRHEKVSTSLTLTPPVVSTQVVKCLWILESEPNTTFAVRIRDFQFKNMFDMLIINDGNSLYSAPLRIFDFSSIRKKNFYLPTSSNRLYVSYSSESLIPSSTFEISAEVQTHVTRFNKDTSFSILPNTTSVNDTTVFYFQLEADKQVEITLQDNSVLSPRSQVVFYDESGDEEILLANFTSPSQFYPVFSIGNQLRLEAKYLSKNNTLRGESRGVSKGCDVFSRDPTGSYQLNSADEKLCTWLIQPSRKNELVFLNVATSKSDNSSHVRIFSGLRDSNDQLVREFNATNRANPSFLIPSTNGARVDFLKDPNLRTNDSLLTGFFQVIADCNQYMNVTHGSKYHIQNPGYPSIYPLNANCTWQLSVPAGKMIRMGFADVKLYPAHKLEILAINNGTAKTVASLSGEEQPDDLILDESVISINWISLANESTVLPFKGFHIEVDVIDCGGLVTAATESVSPPENVTGEIVCMWVYNQTKNHPNYMYNVKFHYEGLDSLNGTVLEFHDGGSLSSPAITKPQPDNSIFSRSSKLVVYYRHTNTNTTKPSLKVTMESHECDEAHQCKNKICMQEGWRCNGKNDCGDFSDEENCGTIIEKSGISASWLVVAIIFSLAIGIGLTIVAPRAFRKARDMRQTYQDFHTLPDA